MAVERWSDRIWVVQLGDDPLFSEDIDYLRAEVRSADRAPDLVLDLSGIEQINSSNLSQLLRLRKLMIDMDGRMFLTAPPDSVWAVFISTGLDKVFRFHEDTSTALADLQLE